MLGGAKSILHREVPDTQKWPHVKDGDLWEVFTDLVRTRGPQTVCITKVKGHATQEMVDEGKVEEEDMRGNSMADKAAEMGLSRAKGRSIATVQCTAGGRSTTVG